MKTENVQTIQKTGKKIKAQKAIGATLFWVGFIPAIFMFFGMMTSDP